MADEATVATGEALGEGRGDDRRCRRSQHRCPRSRAVQALERGALDLEDLGAVLLDEIAALDGMLEGLGDDHPRCRPARVRDQPVRGQLVQPGADQRRGAVAGRIVGIPDPHRPVGAGEDLCPGPTDQPRSDDGDDGHDGLLWRDDGYREPAGYSQSTWRRRSRFSLSAREGPTWVTAPRSSATVRSDSASARSRW